MAVYEYLCPQCNEVFEVRRSMAEADKPATCARCGSAGRKLVTNFGSKTGAYIQAALTPMRPGTSTAERED